MGLAGSLPPRAPAPPRARTTSVGGFAGTARRAVARPAPQTRRSTADRFRRAALPNLAGPRACPHLFRTARPTSAAAREVIQSHRLRWSFTVLVAFVASPCAPGEPAPPSPEEHGSRRSIAAALLLACSTSLPACVPPSALVLVRLGPRWGSRCSSVGARCLRRPPRGATRRPSHATSLRPGPLRRAPPRVRRAPPPSRPSVTTRACAATARRCRLIFTVDEFAAHAFGQANSTPPARCRLTGFLRARRGCAVRDGGRCPRARWSAPWVIGSCVANPTKRPLGQRRDRCAPRRRRVARRCVVCAVADRVIAPARTASTPTRGPRGPAARRPSIAGSCARLHPRGRVVTVDVPPGRRLDLRRLGAVADAVVLMAYDQHHSVERPWPHRVAPLDR